MTAARDVYKAMGGKDAEWEPRVVDGDDASSTDDAEGLRPSKKTARRRSLSRERET
jgi:hypothetical protein